MVVMCTFKVLMRLNIIVVLIVVMYGFCMSTVGIVMLSMWFLMIVIFVSILLGLWTVGTVTMCRKEDWSSICVFIRTNSIGIVNSPVILMVIRGMRIMLIL